VKDGRSRDNNEETTVEWQYNGHPCTGLYQPRTSAVVLNFLLKTSSVVITYRIVDQDSMTYTLLCHDYIHMMS
jgi:hypothetical protein